MATFGLFIHPQAIKDTAYIDNNVDEKLIINSTQIAQELHILPVLGTGLYDEIKAEVESGVIGTDNDTLLKTYIQPALKFWVLFESVDVFVYKIENKSLAKKTSENSIPISENEIISLKEKFKNIAEWHTERIRRYLVQNASDSKFAKYLNPGSGVDIIYPRHDSFQSGWYLGRTTNRERINPIDKYENPATYC